MPKHVVENDRINCCVLNRFVVILIIEKYNRDKVS
jgi:hypothetical protein